MDSETDGIACNRFDSASLSRAIDCSSEVGPSPPSRVVPRDFLAARPGIVMVATKGLKKVQKGENGAAGSGAASTSARRGAAWIPTKSQLRGAQVGSTSTANAGDNKLHIYLLEYCQSLELYGTRPLVGSCFL